MIATFVLVYLLALYVACYFVIRKTKDYLNPLHIFLAIMLLPYLVFYCSNITLLHEKTYWFYIITVTFFVLGYLFIALIPIFIHQNKMRQFSNTKDISKIVSSLKPLLNLFCIIGLIGFGLGAMKAFQFSKLGPGGFFFNLRYANTYLRLNIGIPKYMMLFLHVALLSIIVLRKKKYNNKYVFFLIFIWLFSCIFTMARTGFLQAILSISTAYYLSSRFIYKDPHPSLKPFFYCGLFFCLIFFWSCHSDL